MTHKVLIVLTSHDTLGDTGQPTGFWLEELAVPYYVLLDKGVELDLASPKGGHVPLDPKSDDPQTETEEIKRFKGDITASAAVAGTLKLSEVNAADYDAVFYPGGHGPLWDLVDDKDSIKLIEEFWAAKKPVSAVCHAPIALVNAKDGNGEPIVKGRKVTGFSNAEEDAVELTNVVPVLVEDALIKRGGDYHKVAPFEPLVLSDDHLITGQNPGSSRAVAEALLKALK